jgi:hypothetical protein
MDNETRQRISFFTNGNSPAQPPLPTDSSCRDFGFRGGGGEEGTGDEERGGGGVESGAGGVRCQVRVVEAFVANNDRGGRGGGGGQRHDSTVRPPRGQQADRVEGGKAVGEEGSPSDHEEKVPGTQVLSRGGKRRWQSGEETRGHVAC